MKHNAECAFGEVVTQIELIDAPQLGEYDPTTFTDITPARFGNISMKPAVCKLEGYCTYIGGYCTQKIFVREPIPEIGEQDLVVSMILLNTARDKVYLP